MSRKYTTPVYAVLYNYAVKAGNRYREVSVPGCYNFLSYSNTKRDIRSVLYRTKYSRCEYFEKLPLVFISRHPLYCTVLQEAPY